MAVYQWDPSGMAEVFVLPAAVVDAAMKLASPEQLQALLWFSRHGQQWDAAACAADLGRTPAEWESHLQFWVQQGLLRNTNGAEAPAAPVRRARPAAVKPLLPEVLAYQESHREFRVFLEEVSARLGKPLSHGDVSTLLYLTTTAGLEQAAVLLIAGYAVSMGKPSTRYMEVTALDWADRDILTPDQVDKHIQEMLEKRKKAAKVQAVLGLATSLNASQTDLAYKWVVEWGFSDVMLQHAQTQTNEKCKKFTMSYMDKILEHWWIDGIKRPDQIPQSRPSKRGAAATNPEQSGLDMEGFEEQLLQYRPKYKKNGS